MCHAMMNCTRVFVAFHFLDCSTCSKPRNEPVLLVHLKRKCWGPLPIDSVYHQIAYWQGQGKDFGTPISITNVGQFNCPLCVCLARVNHSSGSVHVGTRQTARRVGCAVYQNCSYALKSFKPFLWNMRSINLRSLDGIPSSVRTQPHIWCDLHIQKRSIGFLFADSRRCSSLGHELAVYQIPTHEVFDRLNSR